MRYWLMKSEPSDVSIDDLAAMPKQSVAWYGVRNYQARNFMREMKLGDLVFFYHSNIGLEVVGVCEVCALSKQDPTTEDPRWDCMTIRALAPMPKPVSLKDVKANPKLEGMSLVTSFRLSVQPVTAAEWKEVCRMGGMDPKTLKAV
jgi:predicted RNA-binding protein with PUA-like domain